MLPEKSAGFKERISLDVYQQRILERLGKAAEATRHHFGVYYSATTCRESDRAVPLFIHLAEHSGLDRQDVRVR